MKHNISALSNQNQVKTKATSTPPTGPTPSVSANTIPTISAKTYRSLKAKLKHQESSNYDSIFIIPCSGNSGWYEIAEHSALIYYYEVCQHPDLQLKPNFFSDENSFYDQYTIGYIRTKNLNDIRDNLKKAKLYASEQKTGATYTFKLSTKYTEPYLKELLSRENNRRLNNLTPSQTESLDPALHQSLANLSARLHNLCNSHLNKLASQTNGVRIVNLIDGLLLSYHQLTYFPKSARTKIKSTLETMRRNIYTLTIEIQILGNTKLWDFEICASLAISLEKSRDLIENDLKQILKKGELS